LKIGLDELRSAGTLRAGLVNRCEPTATIADTVTAEAADWPAHAAETSLMHHLRPERLRRSEIRDDPDRTGELVLGYTAAETSFDASTGAPTWHAGGGRAPVRGGRRRSGRAPGARPPGGSAAA